MGNCSREGQKKKIWAATEVCVGNESVHGWDFLLLTFGIALQERERKLQFLVRGGGEEMDLESKLQKLPRARGAGSRGGKGE